MANTTNSISTRSRSQSVNMAKKNNTSTKEEEIYSIITRSQATQLVDFYYQSEMKDDSNVDQYSFYKFKELCNKSCIFDNISLSILHATIRDIYIAIYHLQTYVFIRDMPDIKDYADLKIELPSGKNTMKMLHYAVDNYIYTRNKYNVSEDLNDRFLEDAVCTICQHDRSGIFYFNTMYGLNKPVCSFCILDSNSCTDDKKDPDYVITAQEYDEASGDEDDDYDSDEEESDEEESDEDESDYDESEEDESEDEESDYDESDEDESDYDESEDEESDYEESEDEESEDEESEDEESEEDEESDEHVKNCTTCYERVSNDEEGRVCVMCREYIDGWKDGWEDGWEDARKYFTKAVRNTPIPKSPRCANCGVLFSKLKRCGGTCEGIVKYCSSECQRTHWNNIHKNDCRKV